MSDLIITPSSGKIDFIYQSGQEGQTSRLESIIIDPIDGLVFSGKISASSVNSPLNITATSSNINYPFIFASSGETGAKSLLMDSAGGTYNPSTNLATVNISGTSSWATNAVTNANLTGDVTSVGNATTIANSVVTNAKLANSSVTIGSTAISLGAAGAQTTIVGLVSVTSTTFVGALTGTATTASYANALNAANSYTVVGITGNLTGTATTASYANNLNAANQYTVGGITGSLFGTSSWASNAVTSLACTGNAATVTNGLYTNSTLTAGNLSGTIPSAVLGNSTVYIGSTAVPLNRANTAIVLTGITSIDGNAATATTATTASYANNLNAANQYTVGGITGSLFGTSSWATNATNALTATNATQLNGQADSYYTNIPARLGYTPVNQTGGTITGNLTVNGNFSVNGSFTAFSASNVYISSSQLYIEDNILTLNAFSPYLRYAGVEMYDSGSGTLSSLLWDGEADYFFLSGSSVNGKIITGPDGQTNLTANFVPKATAGYKLGNSLIYDNGTSLGINTTTPTAKLEIAGGLLASQSGSSISIGTFSANNGNSGYLSILETRFATGSDWQTARTRIQKTTDVTNQAYIDFNPTGGLYGIALGTGAGGIERLRIDSSGNVGIGTTSTAAKLHINASGSSINLLRGVTYNDSNASFNNASLEYYDTSTSDASTVTKINYNAYFNKRGTANITGYTIGNFNGSTQIDSGSVNLIWDYSSRIEIRNQATASSLVHFVADSGYVTAQGGVLGKATDRIGFFVRSQNQSALTLTNQYGIYIEDLGQSTNNYAFYSNVSAASNKYNIYAAGTANNYFAGYVGIGATSFVYGAANRGLLEVYGSSDALIALRNDTANFYIHKSGNNFAMVNGGAGYMTFNTNGSDRLYIDSNGYIGIATTSILTTGGNAQLSISTNTTAVALSFGASNNDMSYIRRLSAGVYQWQTYNSGNTGQIHLQPYGGSVGIGTTSPSSTLHVNSTTAGATLLRTDGTNGTLFSVVDDLSDSLMSVNNSAGLPVLEVFADDRIVMGQYGQNDFVLVNNKVGIGTNNPVAELHVTASSNIPAAVFIGDVGVGTTAPTAQSNYRFLQVNGTDSAIIETMVGGARIGGFDSTSNTLYVGSIGSYPIVFRTAVDEKMRISANGNVGIGTSSPAQKLEVQSGSVLIRGDGTALFGTYYASAGENTFFTLHSGSGNTFHIGNDVSGTNYTTMVFTAATDSTGGKVGIGTTNPVAKLQVNGNISGSSFTSSISNAVGFLGTSSWASNATNALQLGGTAAADYVTLTGTQTLTGKTITGTFTGNLTGTATTASYANALNAANSYTVVGITGNLTGNVTGTATTASYANALNAANSYTVTGITGVLTGTSSWATNATNALQLGGTAAASYVTLTGTQTLTGKTITGTFTGALTGTATTASYANALNPDNSYTVTGITMTNLTGAYQNTTVYDSPRTQSATPSRGIRAPASSIQFTDSYAIAPYYTYRSTGDWPVPYGIGWGTGGESSGIFQRYASNGSSFGDMVFYTGNDGSGAFSFRRHVWESTTYFPAGSNHLNDELFRVDWAGNASLLGTLTANVTGNLAGTATTASYANTLNPANIYTGLNFLATGYLQSGNGQIRSDTAMALLTTGGQAQIVSTKGILLGTSYDTNPGANEIRTTNNTSLYLNARGTGDIQFQTADSLKMMLLNNGNVGIGVSSPAYKLDVSTSITSRSNISTPRFSSAGGYVYGLTNSPSWNQSCGTYTNNNATAPDGTTSAGTYTLNSTCASYDLYQTISSLTVGRVYTIGMWVKLGTATNFCLVVNNTISWNSIGGKAFTSSDGLSTGKWTHISYTFTQPTGSNQINIHLGYHAETAVTQQTAGTVFLWNIEMTEFSSAWIGNVEDEIRLPGSSIWTSRGNVGIGTTSPLTLLDVRSGYITAGTGASTNGSTILAGYYSNTAGVLTVLGTEYSSGGPVLGYAVTPSTSGVGAFFSSTTIAIPRSAYVQDGGTHRWYTGASQTVAIGSAVSTSEKVRITSAGNVGIGTTSPASNLEVQGITDASLGGIGLQTQLWVSDNRGQAAGVGGGISFSGRYINSNATQVTLGAIRGSKANDTTTNTVGNLELYAFGGDFKFYSEYGGLIGANTELVTIKANGNVGIGTTSVGSPLEVYGTSMDPSLTPSATSIFNINSLGAELAIGRMVTSPHSIWLQGKHATVTGSLTYPIVLNPLGGFVGIGTTAPAATLHVSGSSGATATFQGSTQSTMNLKVGSFDNYLVGTSTGDISIRPSGSTAVTILSNGSVGIGTTSPGYKLDVNGPIGISGFRFVDQSTNYFRIFEPAGNIALYLGDAADQTNYYDNTTHYFRNRGGASYYVTINSSGNVGIGTTSPTAKLVVMGEDIYNYAKSSVPTAIVADSVPEFLIGSTDNIDGEEITLRMGSVLSSYYTHGAYVKAIQGAGVDYYKLAFGTSNGAAATTKMTIANDGNVGIGTTVPVAKLEISSSTAASLLNIKGAGGNGILFVSGSGNVGIGTTVPVAKLHLSSTTAGATLLRTDGTNGTLFSVVDDLSDSLMSVNNSAGLPVLEVFADDRIVAGQYGQNDFVVVNNKVGIGTNNPLAKLHVTSSTSIPSAIFMGGNVGIGTTNPVYRLQLGNLTSTSTATPETLNLGGTFSNSAGSNIKLRVYDEGTAIGGMSVSSGQMEVNTWSTGKIAFYRGTTQSAIIDASGNLGVGTSVPTTPLHVVGVISGSSFTGAGTGLTGTATSLTAGTANSVAWTNVSGRPTAVSSFTNDSGYLTSVTNISGNAATATIVNGTNGQLLFKDIRTIAPNNITAGYLQFGFTAWNNNGDTGGIYADYLHLRSYSDSSGGLDNLLMFRKVGGLGIRLWQQTFGSATAYATYKDVCWTDGTNASGNWSITSSWASNAVTSLACTGNAATVTNGVYTIGAQSIAGNKTFTGTTIVTGSIETAAVRETFSAVSSTTTVSIDLSTATVFNLTFTSTISAFNITNVNTSRVNSFTLITAPNGTGATIAWSFQTNGGGAANVKWASNVSPTATTTTGRFDIFSFVYNGTNWYGFTGGQNYV